MAEKCREREARTELKVNCSAGTSFSDFCLGKRSGGGYLTFSCVFPIWRIRLARRCGVRFDWRRHVFWNLPPRLALAPGQNCCGFPVSAQLGEFIWRGGIAWDTGDDASKSTPGSLVIFFAVPPTLPRHADGCLGRAQLSTNCCLPTAPQYGGR